MRNVLKTIMILLVVILFAGLAAVAYLIVTCDASDTERSIQEFAEFPGGDIEAIVVESRSVQKFGNEPGYEIVFPTEAEPVSIGSCLMLDSDNVTSSISEETKRFLVSRLIVNTEGSSLRTQSIDVACDYSAADVASMSVGGIRVFDMFPTGEEDDTMTDMKISGIHGFDVGDGDIVKFYANEISVLNDNAKVISGEFPIYYLGETEEDTPLEFRIPGQVMTDTEFFPDMKYTNEMWSDMEYSYELTCITHGCTETDFTPVQ